MKVDFVICGTQKGGTTALDAYLRAHPEVCMGNRKEVHFFDNEQNFGGDAVDYSVYHEAFSPRPGHRVIGEATPIYMYWYDAPRRIWEYSPEIKLIVLLRNPVERAYSQWNMQRTRGTDPLPFWEALQCERERCRKALPYQNRPFSYVDRGFYTEQLRRLWTFFPEEQVLILRSEDLRLKPNETLSAICRFLGIDPFRRVEVKDVHSRPYASVMTEREKDHLRAVFEFEIRELERLLGWDCSGWLSQ